MDSARRSQTAGSPAASTEEHLPLRVLIVEDHADTAATTAMLLRLCGHDCQIAGSGEAALEAVGAYQPDVVLLDIGLPGLNGLEVARKLREKAERRRPFLIAITGHDREEDRQRSCEAGIDLHLVKPLDSAQLEKVLMRFKQLFETRAASPDLFPE
ncbi:MAG TPA: response regulator [Gemmataceae bacterium]|nr:response regulator [Gemmataceae bacterium]